MVKNISVVIPAFNEEKNILLLVKRLSAALQKSNLHYELIFVDDRNYSHKSNCPNGP
jgi:dolichol-phosphate mannosyltransferase